MGLSDKQTAKVAAFVAADMEAGESVLAILGQAMKGPSLWALALLGSILVFLQTPYAIVVTDRRVLLVRLKTGMTGYPPKELEATYPRNTVSGVFKHGPITGRFILTRPGVEPLSLSVARIYLNDAGAVAAALATAPSPTPDATS